ncbi:MAG: MFS transporter, partial [Firmicutes bacterium]|nr:MFS transporter [Bacillota bacterium]
KVNEKAGMKDFVEVLKNPMVWAFMIVTLVGYSLYTLQGYFTPYLTAVVGVSTETSGIFAIIRTYVFLVLAPVGGFFADKVFKSTSKWLGIAFAIMAVVVVGFLIMPAGAPVMFLSFYTLLPSAFVQMTYTIKYSCINETNVPLNRVAVVTSLSTIAGSLADVVFSPTIAFLLDTQGNNAYTVLFVMLTVLLVLGTIGGFIIAKNNKKAAA